LAFLRRFVLNNDSPQRTCQWDAKIISLKWVISPRAKRERMKLSFR
jgi:hypothetical protein